MYPLLEYTLDPDIVGQIISRSVDAIPTDDGTLYGRGDPPENLYFVERGEVLITLAADRHDVIFRAGEGSLIGIAAVVTTNLRH